MNTAESIVSCENPGAQTVGWSMEDTDAKEHLFFLIKNLKSFYYKNT